MTVNCLGEIQFADFLERTIPPWWVDVSLEVHKGMWFQHNSDPHHSTHKVCNWLNNHFPGTRLGHGDPTLWTPHSYLNPFYFFLWGCMYAMEVQDHDEVINHILVDGTDIRGQAQTTGFYQGLHYCQFCMQGGGDNFEQFLWMYVVCEFTLHYQTCET
jgi:hypothetical protein